MWKLERFLIQTIALWWMAAAASSSSSTNKYSVRSLTTGLLSNTGDATTTTTTTITQQQQQQQLRHRRDQFLTFSDEGIPYEIPLLTIRLFPISVESLSFDSLRAIEMAMTSYLKDKLTEEFAKNNSNSSSSTTADGEDEDEDEDLLTDVTVTVLDDRSVQEEGGGGRIRQRRLHHQQQQHRQLRQGSEVDMSVRLDFAEQPIPSDTEIATNVAGALSDMDDFIDNYLLQTNELQNVDSIRYDVRSFTIAPTVATPTPSPTSVPTVDSGINLENNNDGTNPDTTIAQANRGEPVSGEGDGSLKALYPAVIVGVVAMALTMLLLAAHRRKRVSDYDDDQSGIQRAKDAPVEIDTEEQGWVEHMPDGQTTIHIPHMDMPVDDGHGNGNGNGNGMDPAEHYHAYARQPSSASGHILSSASSMGSSFDEREYYDVMGDLLPSIHHGDGRGYASEEDDDYASQPSQPMRGIDNNGQSSLFPPIRGAVKRVDMTGPVR